MFKPRYILLFWPALLTIALGTAAFVAYNVIENQFPRVADYLADPSAYQVEPGSGEETEAAAPPAAANDTDARPPLNQFESTIVLLYNGIWMAFWLAFAWLHCRLIDVFFWQAVVQRRTGIPPPRLLVDIIRVVVFILFVAIIIKYVFDRPLTGLLVSSGVIGIVLGFALQRMISDFFSGIALNVERPFNVGDWIQVDGTAGEVIEINWRATRLVTLDHVMVVLPNAKIAESKFYNYDQPNRYFRTEFPIALEYSVPLRDAKRVLLGGIAAVDGVLTDPQPDVIFDKFGNDGVEYRVRFFIRSYKDINVLKDKVGVSVSEHMWHAGMSVPYPKRDVYHTRMPPRDVDRDDDRDELLVRCELFDPLTGEEVKTLAEKVKQHRIEPGDPIIKQDAEGDSLFVVVDGTFDVMVKDNRREKKVGRIEPGQYFGEMSLLTGEPRSATVVAATEATVYELTKDMIAPILTARPEIAEELSRVIADRRVRTDTSLKSMDAIEASTVERNLTEELFEKMRSFFGLNI